MNERLGASVSRHETLRELIVRTIRDGIIAGEWKPGEHITEPELAERFGISRTPIREAFRQLESEGFLTTTPRKGSMVAPVSVRDIREFYEIKSLLEGFAARKACEHITDAQIDAMEERNEHLLAAFRREDLEEMVRLHNEFHEIFVDAAGNARLAQLIKSLVVKFQRFRVLLSLSDAMEDLVEQHRLIVVALRDRDAERAEELVQRNAQQGEQRLRARLEQRSRDGSLHEESA